MVTVHKVRYGLATNSSSSHSLIILPQGHRDVGDSEHFGWDDFTLGSAEQKTRYAAAQLRHAMEDLIGSDAAHAVAQAWTGTTLADPDGYCDTIDHQSTWALPLDWKEQSVDKPFFDDLLAFLRRDDVVVLGGNDNSDGHPLAVDGFDLPLQREGCSKGLVCRKDETGGYWTLFNRKTGTKVRMSFDNGQAIEPVKAHAPELVDIKITDYCPFNCEFCYQDSTVKGQHADAKFLDQLAYTFGKMGVFEVALGGGEPTLHPNFVETLGNFRRHGVVPNFTTKNLAWLRDHKLRQRILSHAGAFAYSIESVDDLKTLAGLRDTYAIPNEQVNCQFVMGTGGDRFQWQFADAFAELLTTAAVLGMRLTLLGYKTDGRGHTVKPVDYSGWVTVLKRVVDSKVGRLSLGIDTALAASYQGQLADLGVPKWCYEIQEGKFSMYVDAVEMTTARSSYGSDLVRNKIMSNAVPSSHRNFKQQNLDAEILAHFERY